MLASQGRRDAAFRTLGQTVWANDLVIRAAVEAQLGGQERAMELLREVGSRRSGQELHGLAGRHEFRSLRDYPPFQQFTSMTR